MVSPLWAVDVGEKVLGVNAIDLVRNLVLAQTSKQLLEVLVWGNLLEPKKFFELSLKGFRISHFA